ncbi:MAG: DNA-protecting protein DprA [Desulfamplus sp.]|nr:DNA-protecting protein DprA [Desulfamplus sp.]
MSQIIHQYLPWFILKNIPGVGNILYRRLIQRFGSPENVFTASSHDLITIKGMGKKVLSAIMNNALRSSAVINELKEEIRQIERSGFKILTMTEDNYPSLLQHIPDPPPYLTYFGTLDNSLASIAIVGSRQATSYGLNVAETLAHDLASKKFKVVSGMAVGIDSAAHKGALRAQGKTVAILGSGLGRIYPSENRNLFFKIADNGAVISEFKINSEPEGRHFPMRNRIIAGMSAGTVVVEAATKSGSLITARLAAEYNREVFAVPGSIDSFKSAGTHALLKQGARLVENHMDIIEEFYYIHQIVPTPLVHDLSGIPLNEDPEVPSKSIISPSTNKKIASDRPLWDRSPLKEELPLKQDKTLSFDQNNSSPFEPDQYQHAILNILKDTPLHIDQIIETSGLDTGGITAALMDLELMGIIIHSPGKMFYKV